MDGWKRERGIMECITALPGDEKICVADTVNQK